MEGILPEGRDVILPVAGGGVYRGEECRKIVYCKDGSRKGTYPNTQFDFLGYTFRARTVKNSKKNSLFVSFTPAVSSKAVTAMRQKTRKLNYRNRTDLSLADIAACTTRSFAVGWSITASSVARRCTLCCGTST